MSARMGLGRAVLAGVLLLASVVAGAVAFYAPVRRDGITWIQQTSDPLAKPTHRVTYVPLQFEDGVWSIAEDAIVTVPLHGHDKWTLQRSLGQRRLSPRVPPVWPAGAPHPRQAAAPAAFVSTAESRAYHSNSSIAFTDLRTSQFGRELPVQFRNHEIRAGEVGALFAFLHGYGADHHLTARHRAHLEVVFIDEVSRPTARTLDDVRARLVERGAELASQAGKMPDTHLASWWKQKERSLTDVAGLSLVLGLPTEPLAGVVRRGDVNSEQRKTNWIGTTRERVRALTVPTMPGVASAEAVTDALSDVDNWSMGRGAEWIARGSAHPLSQHPVVIERRERLLAWDAGVAETRAAQQRFRALLAGIAALAGGVWWLLRRRAKRSRLTIEHRASGLRFALAVALTLASLHARLFLRLDLATVGLVLVGISVLDFADRRLRRAGWLFVASAALLPVAKWTGALPLDVLAHAISFAGIAALLLFDRSPRAPRVPDAPVAARKSWPLSAVQDILVVGIALVIVRYAFEVDPRSGFPPTGDVLSAVWLLAAVLSGTLLVDRRATSRGTVLRVPLAAYALTCGVSAHAVQCVLLVSGSRTDGWPVAFLGALAAAVIVMAVVVRILFHARLRRRTA